MRAAHNILQFITIVGAGIVPLLLTISQVPKLIPTIISGVVFVTASLANHFKLRERSHIDRLTAEAMWKEIEFYNLSSGLYKNLEDEQAFNLFVERTQQLLDEHFTRVIAFEGPNQDHKVDEYHSPYEPG